MVPTRLERFPNQLVTLYLTLLKALLSGRDPWFGVSVPLSRISPTRTFLGGTRPEGVLTKKKVAYETQQSGIHEIERLLLSSRNFWFKDICC